MSPSSWGGGGGVQQPSVSWCQAYLGQCSGLTPGEQPQGWGWGQGRGKRGRLGWQPLNSLSPLPPARRVLLGCSGQQRTQLEWGQEVTLGTKF